MTTVTAHAPGRVNLIGEHTDYNRGLCLPFALPLFTTAIVTARDDDVVRVRSHDLDESWAGRLGELEPGREAGWAAYVPGVLWALREEGWPVPGVDVEVRSDVPLGAGLSSSAALECAVAAGVAALLDRQLDRTTRRLLAEACRRAETSYVGAPTGGMDQLACLLAEEDHAVLLDFAEHSADPVPLPLRSAGLTVLVTDTGAAHTLSDSGGGYAQRRAECERAAAALGVGSLRSAAPEAVRRLEDATLRARATHVVTENARVVDTIAAVGEADWAALGALLTASHVSLRDDFAVSADLLDLAVDAALSAGALGARMTGGGFGGSTIALVDADRGDGVATAVRRAFEERGHAVRRTWQVTPAAGATAGVRTS